MLIMLELGTLGQASLLDWFISILSDCTFG